MATVQDPNFNSSNTANSSGGASASPGQTGNFSQPISVSGSEASGPGGYKGNAGAAGQGQASSSSGASNTAATTNAPSSSGQYNNLQNYVNANQNYTNNGGLASQLSSDYSKQAQGAQNNITDASNNWYNTNSGSDVNPNQAQTYVNGALQNAYQFSQDPNNVSQFQNYLNAGTNYVAPTQFDPTQMYQQQVQNYNQSVGQLGTSTGRQAALQQMYNNPYYSQGQQSLDNLILGSGVNTNTGVNQLQQLQQNATGYGQGLQNVYNNTASGINGTIDPTTGQYAGGAMGQYANDAATTQANAQGALGSAITGTYDAANNQLSSALNPYSLAQAALTQDQLTPDMIAKLGLNPQTTLYNVDPSKYLTPGIATISNVITPEQQAAMNGYTQLAGTYVPTGTAGSDLTALKGNQDAGTFNPYTFNTSAFNTAVQGAGANLANSVQNLQNNPDFTSAGNLNNDAYGDLQSLQNYYQSIAPGGVENGYAQQPTESTAQSAANGGAYTTTGQQIQNEIQSLTSLMQSYGIDPTTGLGKTFTTIPNFAGASAAPGPSLGDNGTPIPMHGGGITIPSLS